MKPNKRSTIVLLAVGLAALSTAHAGTILTSGFSAVTTANVTTTGLAGYGFFSANNPAVNNGLFGDGTTQTSGLFSTISNQNATPTALTTVSLIDPTLTDLRAALGAQTSVGPISFGGAQAYGAYGGFPGNAGDIWSLSFADLAASLSGEHYRVTLYGGHSAGDRVFDVEAALTGTSNNTVQSGQISALTGTLTGGGFTTFRYDIDFTAAADDDLSLTFGSISGGGGGAFLAGYTVAIIPEPSTVLLGGLGLLVLLRRRR